MTADGKLLLRTTVVFGVPALMLYFGLAAAVSLVSGDWGQLLAAIVALPLVAVGGGFMWGLIRLLDRFLPGGNDG
ncbi:hypothetical protein [Streptomonospora nanhaiensis]|uniref:hypothetical protein n=1 Tax=Streptomonospora nanhaiensis TaxID=1323731 RepID=UPI001C38FA38|nr:hypothetical protein [Streptomonospora nanhaiensis]MBV2364279.1 hypothetical protein [Streptomonospora nanhaiensis]